MKKAQVTIFIIAGIIILLSAGLFLYLQSQLEVVPPPKVLAPPEISSITRYIDDCLQETATDAVYLIGEQGGFIKLPEEVLNSQRASLPSPLKTKIPLWRYRGTTRIPSEELMKEEIAMYVEQKIDECLQGLEIFRDHYQIQEGEKTITVDLTGNGVGIKLDYPLNIIMTASNQNFSWSEFETRIPLRLKTAYELARQVMEKENTDLFVEDRIIDLIALDPDIPYTNTEFSCSPKTWRVPEIESKLKQLLEINTPLLRVDKTSYAEIPEEQEYVKNHYVWTVTETEYPNTHIAFSFDQRWPIDLNINPRNGQVLQSEVQRGDGLMSFFCMNMWHFTYDIKNPVLVTITDDATGDHEKYTFSFGFETGIQNNEPDSSNFGFDYYEATRTAKTEEYCATPGTTLTIHTFENITTETEPITEEIADVNVSFTCIKYTCNLGMTDWQYRGAVSWLQAEVPYCTNGILKGNKEGYEEGSTFVTTGEEKRADLYLRPILDFDVEVVKHYQETIMQEEPLTENEIAIITIKRKDYETETYYPQIEESKLRLLDKNNYEYELLIYLLDDTGIKGGYQATWKPDIDKLQLGYTIKFHVIEWPYVDPEKSPLLFAEYLDSLGKTNLPEPEIK